MPVSTTRTRSWPLPLGVTLATGAYAVLLRTAVPTGAAQGLSDIMLCVVPAAAAGACLRAARRTLGRERRAWSFLAASAASWAAGTIVWTYFELVAHLEVPFPSFADVFYLAAVPLAAVSLLSFPAGRSGASSGVRTLIDSVTLSAAVFLVSWATVLGPLYRASSGSLVEQAVGLAYPVGDMVLAAIVGSVWTRGSSRQRLRCIALGVLCLSVADSGFAYLTLVGAYGSGHPIDAAWVGGYLLIGAAAILPASRERANTGNPISGRAAAMPYAVAGLALAVATVRQVSAGGVDAVMLSSMAALVLFVVSRQFLIVLENQALTIGRLRVLDEMKDAFLQAVSHELRTPLTVIKGSAVMLRDADEALDVIRRRGLYGGLVRNCERLEELLEDLLDLDRLTRGQVRARRRPVDVTALVRRVLRRVDVGERHVRLELEHVVASVDPAQVERIVENLLTNVARHTPDATRVWVELTGEAGDVQLTVSDDGPGVPPEWRRRVFDSFARADSSTRAARGAGIGLSLVALFAELHGGSARVEEGSGGGARFIVALPRPDDAPKQAELAQGEPRTPADPPDLRAVVEPR